ncbi:serine protease [Flaviramulus sp. BrNp1-15]|uniref:S1 family peptidase n=1 Tax=Flaviramulus sp. BrNp1-15 TaxID=2916754 RepID=UPI001EE96FA8|nr:serine protease [Flaviramulus sp. BrNp1-15]ULC58584.1 serine protease [Flaviramulus sp. BrNp1-15]
MRNLILFLFFLPISAISQTITQIESLQSLYIETYNGTTKLSSATGFIIKSKTQNYLVTNYHVITNKNPFNNKWLDPKKPVAPNKIVILHNADSLGTYILKTEHLFDKLGNKLWHENKIKNEYVDVIELPLKDTLGVKTYPVNYKKSAYDEVQITTTDRVFILGFPRGVRSFPAFPVWKSGLIASEPDFDQEGKPIMWVDAITFPGMSGSPVYFKSNQMVKLKNGKNAFVTGQSKFMGVFSHSHKLYIYGALWKASYLEKIFDSLP